MPKLLGILIAAAALMFAAFGSAEAQQKSVRIAYGDVPGIESLGLLTALEQVKERGVTVELTVVKSEDLATQAVAGGQADVGIGTPYAAMARLGVPLRMFFQLSTLRFFPVIDGETYKSWKDLDGQDFVVHSRGSGTEAIAHLMAQRNGIKFKSISYVPGSEARALALLRGNIKATIVDSANKRFIEEKGGNRYVFLPMGDIQATDDALFARQEWLQKNAETADILVEELLKVWRGMKKDPSMVTQARTKYKLLPDLPADLQKDIEPYFAEAAKTTLYPTDGGIDKAAREDFAFFTLSGAIQGDPASLKVEDYWDLGPLQRATQKLGRAARLQ